MSKLLLGRIHVLLFALGAAWVPWGFAIAACKLGKYAEFPITMVNLRPMMTAKINDHDVQLLVDSGAIYSMLSGVSAAELDLKTHSAPFGLFVTGVGGGTADVSVARVKVFTLAGVPLHNIDFLVGGSEVGSGGAGLLGQNVLQMGDVEYDLAQGVIRLMKAEDCRKAQLAYWAGNSQPYSVIDIEPTNRAMWHTVSSGFVNGKEIRVMFDTGAGTSFLSLQAAERAGVKPDSPGVVPGGVSYGIDRNNKFDKSIADYDASLKINAKSAWSLYGRGVDKVREHRTVEGQAEMEQAVAIWPQVADEFKRRGITP